MSRVKIMAHRANAGFTLIEVMIVVAMLGVLAALATPNLTGVYRRFSVGTEGRHLYAAFVEALGAAAGTGVGHCLLLDRANRAWQVRRNNNADTSCNASDSVVLERGGATEQLTGQIGFGPMGGVTAAFVAPYATVAHDAWCTACAATAGSCALFFDSDGRIRNSSGALVDGAVMVHDAGAGGSGRVMAVVFIGATGNLRLFDMVE